MIAQKTRLRFHEGMRVRHIGYSCFSGVPNGTTGTVAKVATARGPSIFSDPLRRMVFVHWDNGLRRAVFRNELEKVDA